MEKKTHLLLLAHFPNLSFYISLLAWRQSESVHTESQLQLPSVSVDVRMLNLHIRILNPDSGSWEENLNLRLTGLFNPGLQPLSKPAKFFSLQKCSNIHSGSGLKVCAHAAPDPELELYPCSDLRGELRKLEPERRTHRRRRRTSLLLLFVSPVCLCGFRTDQLETSISGWFKRENFSFG